MNIKGEGLMLVLIITVTVFVFGVLFVNFVMDDITTTRNDLDCNNAGNNISDGTKVACLITDGTIPYFVVLVVSLAGGLILSRFAT